MTQKIERIIGIDPGTNGALVELLLCDWNPLGVSVISGISMPTKEGKKRKEVDGLGIAEWIRSYDPATTLVMIETPFASPGFGMGVSGAFSFGRAVGIVYGVLDALQFNWVGIAPAAWKRRAELLKQPKSASLALAQKMWPEWGLSQKNHVDRAEAALIAYFGGQGQGVLDAA